MVRRILFISALTMLAINHLSAQSFPEKGRLRVGAGLEYVLPVGEPAGTEYKTGFAIPVELRYGFLAKTAVFLSGSYFKLPAQAVEDEYLYYQLPDLGAFLIKAGLQYQLKPFYVAIAAGPAIVTRPHPTTALVVSPALGFTYKNIDLNLSAQTWSRPYPIDYLSLQIAYFF